MDNNNAKKFVKPIFKTAGADTFLEVFHTAFEIDKVLIKFSKYDKKDGTGYLFEPICIYMSFAEFLTFAEDVKYGRISNNCIKAYNEANAKGSKYADSIYDLLGGTSVGKLSEAARNKYKLPNGTCRPESRTLSITYASTAKPEDVMKDANNTAYILLDAKRGPGKEISTGLIASDFDYKSRNFDQVQIKITPKDLRGLCAVTKMRLQAYMTAKQLRGDYDINSDADTVANQPQSAQPVNQPVNQPINQPASQPINTVPQGRTSKPSGANGGSNNTPVPATPVAPATPGFNDLGMSMQDMYNLFSA